MEFVAEVLPDNERSHRLFRRAGYEPRGGRYFNAPSMAAA
jgi:RimJ/RimL family protein N-acetyltransferase